MVSEFKSKLCIEKPHDLKNKSDYSVDELEKNLKKLDLDYQTEVDLLDKHVKKACSHSTEDKLLIPIEITQKYENIEKCKHESKELYKICQIELEKICEQMITIVRNNESIETNSLDFDVSTDKLVNNVMKSNFEEDSEDDDDDFILNLKCLNEEQKNELRDLARESYSNLKSVHPNSNLYRNMVCELKSKLGIEKPQVSCEDILKNDLKNKSDCSVDEIEKNLKKLDLDYQAEIDLLDKRVKEACNHLIEDKLLFAEITQKYENIEKCKQESKKLYEICQIELEIIWEQIITIKRNNESKETNFDDSTDKPADYAIKSDFEEYSRDYNGDMTDKQIEELRDFVRESFSNLLFKAKIK